MRVLVNVPTYIEAENIEEVLRRLRAAAPDADVLVIDDNSPDGTADIAERVGQELGQVEVLRRPAKKGLGNAYRAGFGIGIDRGYDVICQMDADLSHDPAALPQLLAAVDAGADLAIGSRYVEGGSVPHWPAHRRAAVALRQPLRAGHARLRQPRLDVGVPGVPGQDARRHPVRADEGERLPVPDRARVPGVAVGWPYGRGAHLLHRPGAGPLEDVAQRRRRGNGDGHLVGHARPRREAAREARARARRLATSGR